MKSIIITWVSEWLGYELAKVFLKNNFQVIGLSRNKPNLDIIHLEIDLTEEKSINKTIEQIKSKYHDFTWVICCAAIWYIENLENDNFKHTESMFKVNIIWQNYLLSKISNLIKSNNSDLIFIGATIWYKANTFMSMYSVTKWWLRWLIENWRLELKDTNSRVIWIHPGWLDTESNIWSSWRETLISEITKKPIWTLLDKTKVAEFIYSTTQLPKNMEISEVIINRK